MDNVFPELKRGLENLIEDEEGTIPGTKLLALGTMIVILGSLLSVDAFGAHSSHKSHTSHSSHVSGSGSSGSGGGSASHESHVSHESHLSHQSHTSHSNDASHSNSSYSSEGDVSYSAPSAYSIPGVSNSSTATINTDSLNLPAMNQINLPNGTPATSVVPTLAVPLATPASKIEGVNTKTPSATESVE